MKEIRQLISDHERDPNSIHRIRSKLSKASQDVILLEEILSYLIESYENLMKGVDEKGPATVKLKEILSLDARREDLGMRIQDLKKIIQGAHHELQGLREMTDVISEQQMFRLQETLQSNTRNLEDVFRSGERTESTLKVVEVILAGSLAFDILEMVMCEWTAMGSNWVESYLQPVMNLLGMWKAFIEINQPEGLTKKQMRNWFFDDLKRDDVLSGNMQNVS